MSGAERSPVLIPSHAVVGREQAVVVEFPRDLPTSGLITLTFHPEGSNEQLAASVPVAKLGPRTLKANFPKFSKPGRVEVSIRVMREESTQFPRFPLCILSPLEAIFSTLHLRQRTKKEEKEDGRKDDEEEKEESLSILASLLAFLAHSSNENETGVVDSLLSSVLWSIPSSSLTNWHLGPLLSGRFGSDENLLHLCMRLKLEETAMALLQPQYVEGKEFYILQKARVDKKMPLDIAHKNGMKRAVELAEMAVDGNKVPTKLEKSRKKQSSSCTLDSDMVPVPLILSKKKEKGHNSGNRLKKLFGKDKEVKMAHRSTGGRGGRNSSTSREESDSPATASLDSIGLYSQVSTTPPHQHQHHHQHHQVSVPTPLSPPVPLGHLHLDSEVTSKDPEGIPVGISHFSNHQEMDRNISSSREHVLPNHHVWQSTASSSLPYEPVSFNQVFAKEYDSGPPSRGVRKLSLGARRQQSTSHLGRAEERRVGEEKEGREDIYQVPNNLPIDNSMSEEDEDIYKVPSSILQISNSMSEEDGDIYKVPSSILQISNSMSEEDGDIYKVPSSILRISNSMSEEDEDIYKVPSSMLCISNSSEDNDIYKIPSNIPMTANSDSESEDIYQVPRSVLVEQCHNESDDDDHSYELVPEEALSEMKLNEMLFSLGKGHYMKVPSRELLLKHTITGIKVGEAQSEVRAKSGLLPGYELVQEPASLDGSAQDGNVSEKKSGEREKGFTSAFARIAPTKAPEIESAHSASAPKEGEDMYEVEVNRVVDDILVELEDAVDSYHQGQARGDATKKSTETVPSVSQTLACSTPNNLNQQLSKTGYCYFPRDRSGLQIDLAPMNVELEEKEEPGIMGTGPSYFNIGTSPLQDLKDDNAKDGKEERLDFMTLSTSSPQDSITKQGIKSDDDLSSPDVTDVTSSPDLKNYVLVPVVGSERTEENGLGSPHDSAINTVICARELDSLQAAMVNTLGDYAIPSCRLLQPPFVCEPPPPYPPPQLSALISNAGEKPLTESRTTSHEEVVPTVSTTSLHPDEAVNKASASSGNAIATTNSCSQPGNRSSPVPLPKPRKLKIDTPPSSLKPTVDSPSTKFKTLDCACAFEIVATAPSAVPSSSHIHPDIKGYKKTPVITPSKPVAKPPSPKFISKDSASTFEMVVTTPAAEQSSSHMPPDVTRYKKPLVITHPSKPAVKPPSPKFISKESASTFEMVVTTPAAEQSSSHMPPDVARYKKPLVVTPSKPLVNSNFEMADTAPTAEQSFPSPSSPGVTWKKKPQPTIPSRKPVKWPVLGPKPSVEEICNCGPVPGPKPSQGPAVVSKSIPTSIPDLKSSQSPALGPKPNMGPVIGTKSSQFPALGPKPNQGPIVGPSSTPSSVPDSKSSQNPALGPKPNVGPPKSTPSSLPGSKPSLTGTPPALGLKASLSPIPGLKPQRPKLNGNSVSQGSKPAPPPIGLKTYQKKNSPYC